MKDLMDYIYLRLSDFAPVYFEEKARDELGNMDIDETNIIYNLEGFYQVSETRAIIDIPMKVDLWYLAKDFYPAEEIAGRIDDLLDNHIFKLSDKATIKISRDPNFLINVPDEDTKIRRKRFSYTIRYYGF